MIRTIAHAALLVREYDEAKRFWCDTLGFEVVEDTQLDGKRWVRIRPAGSRGSEILLSRAATDAERLAVGNQTGGRVLFFLHTDDLAADYRRLRDHGVEFVEEPRTESYGMVAVFKDLYGNRIDLIQPAPKRSPRQVLETWVGFMNTHEPEALAALYAEDAINLQVSVGIPVVGRPGILHDFRLFFRNVPDTFTKVENLFEDGEWAMLEWSGGGTYSATGKTFKLRGCGFFRVIDGLIVFQRGYWDSAAYDNSGHG